MFKLLYSIIYSPGIVAVAWEVFTGAAHCAHALAYPSPRQSAPPWPFCAPSPATADKTMWWCKLQTIYRIIIACSSSSMFSIAPYLARSSFSAPSSECCNNRSQVKDSISLNLKRGMAFFLLVQIFHFHSLYLFTDVHSYGSSVNRCNTRPENIMHKKKISLITLNNRI